MNVSERTAYLISKGTGFVCSACGGFTRQESVRCVRCQRQLIALMAPPGAAQIVAGADTPRCSSCHTPVTAEATSCPRCGRRFVTPQAAATAAARATSRAAGTGRGGVLLLSATILLAVLLASLVGASHDNAQASDARATAWIVCTAALERSLEAPGAARLPPIDEASITHTSDGRWTIVSSVEAQTSLGMPLRQDWTCETTVGGSSSTVHWLTLGDEVLISAP